MSLGSPNQTLQATAAPRSSRALGGGSIAPASVVRTLPAAVAEFYLGRSTPMRVFVSIMLAAVAVSCTRSFGTRVEVVPPLATTVCALDAARVTAIARQAVTTNDTWIASAEFETPHHETDG